jgi:hypothetical protein
MRYKTGVIKSFLHRAYAICSTYETFHQEINRIKQQLTNNNFPLSLIDKTISDFITTKMKAEKEEIEKNETVNLFYQSQMTQNYVQREKQLTEIVKKNVKITEPNKRIKLMIYYKNKKLKNLLIKNSVKKFTPEAETSYIVYQYQCPNSRCQAGENYIGYSTNRLRERTQQHQYKGAIKDHHQTKHGNKPSHDEILTNTKILKRGKDRYELLIIEALLIKESRPTINLQFDGFPSILKKF